MRRSIKWMIVFVLVTSMYVLSASILLAGGPQGGSCG